MANQNLSDLNGYLFEQLERLNEENMTKPELDKETERAKAVSNVARNIIENAKVVLDAAKFYDSGERMDASVTKPKLLN